VNATNKSPWRVWLPDFKAHLWLTFPETDNDTRLSIEAWLRRDAGGDYAKDLAVGMNWVVQRTNRDRE
jgi:hypothetical protein